MKGVSTLLQTLRALHKSGKLDDVISRQLNIQIAKLQHCIHIGDRKNATKHFQRLCELLEEILTD